MRVAMIAALSRNRVIGRDNALPWHLPADLKYFKRVTMGKPLLMGRKTYESIGRALPGRTNIVLTRQSAFAAPGIVVVADPRQALELARAEGAEELMVIGGEEIYRVMLPLSTRLYLTEVDVQVAGDAYFPDIDPVDWHELRREAFPAGDAGCSSYSFVVLERHGEAR